MSGKKAYAYIRVNSGTSGAVRKQGLTGVSIRIISCIFPPGFSVLLSPGGRGRRERLLSAAGLLIAATTLLGAFITPLPAQAEEPDRAIPPQEYFDRGDFHKACQGFHELFRQDPGNPDINFSLGRAAFESGDYEAAVMAFERVLIARPHATRVKLELARCHFHLGSLETAGQYFEEVLAAGPPEQVRANVDRYLVAIRASKREHFLSARLSLGMDFDDNANTAPASSSIEITDLLGNVFPVTVDGAQSDRIRTGTAGLNYLYKPRDSALGWKISALNYNALYRDARDLDVNLFDIRAGLCIEHGSMVWDIYGLMNHLNLDSDRYLRAYGSGATLSFLFSPRVMLSADARYRRKNYYELRGRDADNVSLTLSPAFALGIGHITFSAGWECESADQDVYSYARLNGIAGYQVSLPWSMSAYASYWYQGTDYDDIYPLFGRKRSDDVQYFTIGISRMIWQGVPQGAGITLGLAYTYTRSDSTIDLYTYTKNVTSTNVTFAF